MDNLTLISGTKEDNILTGTDGTDILLGKSGDDVLDGGGGNDLLLAGNGDDQLDGGSGNDLLLAGNGDDLLDGGDGSDILLAGNGDDQLDGGAGDDFLDGGNGDDLLDGGAGSDYLLAGRGDDTLNYTLSENTGETDYYDGGKGFDTLQLTLTSAEFESVKGEIDAFKAFLADGGKVFHFESLGLTVRNFEDLRVETVGGNTAPVAAADEFPASEDAPIEGNVLANDTDVEDGAPSIVSTVNGEAGNVGATIALASGALLTVHADGTFTYHPNGQFEALGVDDTFEDSFTYAALDSEGDASNTATARIVVQGANDRPVARADSNTTNEDTEVTGNVLSNDTDVDNGDTLRVGAVNGESGNVGMQITLDSGALLTLFEDGSYVYDPNAQFEFLNAGMSATDSFTYVAVDSQDLSSDVATVNVTITGEDDAPAAIRVAVVGAVAGINDATAAQLNDSMAFNFDATGLLITSFSTFEQWRDALVGGYDAVVLGEDGSPPIDLEGTPIFAALNEFLDQGGGVVTTGLFASFAFQDTANAEKISPSLLPTVGVGLVSVPSGSQITVNAVDPAGQMIAGGITSYAAQGTHEVASAKDVTATVLATDASGRPAIAYDETWAGRTVYLGSAHMADPFFGSDQTRAADSPVDQLFERAVAWSASFDSDPFAVSSTPVVDDALL